MDARIELDDLQVRAALQRLASFGRGASAPVMQAIGRYMKSSTQLRFRSQSGPDGQQWWPSQRAKQEGGQTLRLTGRLRNSITWRAGADYAEAGTNVAYAAAHQFGVRKLVTIKAHRRMRKINDAQKHRVAVRAGIVKSHVRLLFLPRRPYLGFSQDDRAGILNILLDGIEKAKNG